VQKDVDLDSRDKEGRNPLHWAAYNGNTPFIDYLIENGAEVDTAGTKLHAGGIVTCI
jgi:ankyrin repeat protein